MRVQIILAGVGGQGVLFASKIFSHLGLKLGLNVMGSETHGMSQRGGSVICHLKLGDFRSPLIRTGNADVLYAFDRDETYRAIKFLRWGGVCCANLAVSAQLNGTVLDYLRKRKSMVVAHDASQTALRIGSVLVANIVLIGFSVGAGLVPFKYNDLRDILELVSKEKDVALNLKAIETGYQQGKEFKAKTHV